MSTKTYIHKPTTVQALHWDGTNDDELSEFIPGTYFINDPFTGNRVAMISDRGITTAMTPNTYVVAQDNGLRTMTLAMFAELYAPADEGEA